MTSPKSRMFAAVAGALSLGTVAWAAEPSQQDARIAELEAKIASLEAKQASNSQDVAATIDSVLRDAERRSQLLAASGDMGAGYDSGFFVRAGDAWVLRPGAQFQFRNVTNYRDADDGEGGDDDEEVENGFEIRRMKFELTGTAFTKDLEYAFVWASGRDGDGSLNLEDAFVKYMFADDWGFRAGQFKVPVHHEELTSSKRQLAVDRSLANELLAGGVLDRTQGVNIIYGGYNKNNAVNAEVGLHDGFNEDNTDFTKHDFDFGVAGRVEFKAMGDWKAYRDFSAMGNKEDLLVIGGGWDWSQLGSADIIHGTVDLQWENASGLGIYAAGLIQYAEDDTGDGDDEDDVTNYGAIVQVGYMLNPAWEIFGRYSGVYFDDEGDDDIGEDEDDDDLHEITVGVNYFLGQNGSAGHRAKVTIDVAFFPEGAPEDTGLGILGSTSDDDEIVLRGQFQLLI